MEPRLHRADDGTRTRDPHLGKVMRYQLRYVRLQTPDHYTGARAPGGIAETRDGFVIMAFAGSERHDHAQIPRRTP